MAADQHQTLRDAVSSRPADAQARTALAAALLDSGAIHEAFGHLATAYVIGLDDQDEAWPTFWALDAAAKRFAPAALSGALSTPGSGWLPPGSPRAAAATGVTQPAATGTDEEPTVRDPTEVGWGAYPTLRPSWPAFLLLRHQEDPTRRPLTK